MTDLRAAAEMALEALMAWEEQAPQYWDGFDMKAIAALRQALAQPEQAPTNNLAHEIDLVLTDPETILSVGAARALQYVSKQLEATAPPKREWVSLTTEEIDYIWGITPSDYVDHYALPRAIEAALRIQNNG